MIEEHIYPYFPDDIPKCPYCNEPLEFWQAPVNDVTCDVEWDEETNGSFSYEEKCVGCGRKVKYRLNFVVTCAVVEEEKND